MGFSQGAYLRLGNACLTSLFPTKRQKSTFRLSYLLTKRKENAIKRKSPGQILVLRNPFTASSLPEPPEE